MDGDAAAAAADDDDDNDIGDDGGYNVAGTLSLLQLSTVRPAFSAASSSSPCSASCRIGSDFQWTKSPLTV